MAFDMANPLFDYDDQDVAFLSSFYASNRLLADTVEVERFSSRWPIVFGWIKEVDELRKNGEVIRSDLVTKLVVYTGIRVNVQRAVDCATNDFSERSVPLFSMPKSGSTYTESFLMKYYGLVLNSSVRFGLSHHHLDLDLFCRTMQEDGCITKNHSIANLPLVSLLICASVKPVILCRNIFDALVSMSDALATMEDFRYGNVLGMKNMSFEDNIEMTISRYASLYIDFYATWKAFSDSFGWRIFFYEDFAGNKEDFFSDLCEYIKKDSFDRSRMNSIINTLDEGLSDPARSMRFNKGLVGRGDKIPEHLQDRVKRLTKQFPECDFSPIFKR